MALTTAQIQTLKSAIASETNSTFVEHRTNGDNGGMAAFFNAPSSPAFTVWRTNVTKRETGRAFNGAEWAGMTSANHTRLADVAAWADMGYDPSRADIRAMFDDIWSGAGGVTTRASLLALWKRLATRGERLYATGTGSDAVPGLLVFEGSITVADITEARNLP